MKQPLLSLTPGPSAESADPDASTADLLMQEPPPALTGPEPLIDPFAIAAPPAPRRARSVQIPVSLINLSIASSALLLTGVLLGMKVSDYFHGRYFEKRFAKLFDMPELPAELAPAHSAAVELAAPPAPSPALTPAPIAAPPSEQPAPVSSAATVAAHAPASGAAPANPDVSSELEALRQERQLVSQRFEELSAARAKTAAAKSGKTPSLTDSVAGARLPSSSPSFGNPGTSREAAGAALSAEEQRTRAAPAIARVREYDPDWHFVVLDGGKERNIAPGTQLAVRRGHQILGLIRVDEVEENESVAELQGNWRVDAQGPKPQKGDDVVTYPLF